VGASLRSQDRMSLVALDVALRPIDRRWVSPGTAGMDEMLSALDREFPLGKLDLDQLSSSVEFFSKEEGTRRILLYVGAEQVRWNSRDRTEKSNFMSTAELFRNEHIEFCAVCTRETLAANRLQLLARETSGRLFMTSDSSLRQDLFVSLISGFPREYR